MRNPPDVGRYVRHKVNRVVLLVTAARIYATGRDSLRRRCRVIKTANNRSGARDRYGDSYKPGHHVWLSPGSLEELPPVEEVALRLLGVE